MGIRLMIIELGKYNSAEELLIETRTTGSQGHVYYQGKDRRTSITRAAVCMGLEGTGMRTGHRGAYKWGLSQMSIEMRKCQGLSNPTPVFRPT